MPRNVLPWVLLVVAVVVAVTVLRTPSAQVAGPAASSVPPVVPLLGSATPPPSGPGPSARRYDDPPMDETEVREWHVRVGHEICEEGAKRINELEGLDPTNPKGIRIIGACLNHGNVAWYKCVLKASTRLEAGTCNRRFLSGGGSPPTAP